MTEEKETQTEVFKVSDDLIAIVRELVQLSFLTGTNIVDHMRAILVEVDDETKKIVPTLEYVEAYNNMINELHNQAQQAQQNDLVPQETTQEVEEETSDA